MIEVRVRSLGLDKTSNQPVVLLEECSGGRILPIWIGPGEASAIAMRLADVPFLRPLTHDLLANLVSELGGTLQHVFISRVEQGTFFAEMHIEASGGVVTVDARPSDSIAVALRMGAAMFVSEELLSVIQEGVSEEQLVSQQPESGEVTDTPFATDDEVEKAEMTPEELQNYLRKMRPEDFGRFTP